MKLCAFCLCLALTAPGAAEANTPDARLLALAHRVAAWYGPVLARGSATMAIMAVDGAWSEAGAAHLFPPGKAPSHWRLPLTPLDVRQLNASLIAAAEETSPRITDALTAIFAQAYDAKTLEAVADFYEQPAERALQADRQRLLDQMQEPLFDLDDTEMHGTVSGEQATRGMEAVAEGFEALNRLADDPRQAAEDAFLKTPASQAFSSDDPARAAAVGAAQRAAWPDTVSIAESDYCARRPCDAALHAFFRALADFDNVAPKVKDLDLSPFPLGDPAETPPPTPSPTAPPH